jgi:uncharacterized membrane protein
MNKRTAKKLDKIDSKLLAIYEELENLLNDEIEVQLEKAEDYLNEHEESEKAQEKYDSWENAQSEVQEIIEELDELRSRLQSVYEDFID